jgi:hypothetical protein
MTVRGRTEAHLYRPKDCSAHVCSRQLFDRTMAVPPEHAGPFHLRMRLQRRRSASNAQLNPHAEVQASRRASSWLVSFLSHCISLQQAEGYLRVSDIFSWRCALQQPALVSSCSGKKTSEAECKFLCLTLCLTSFKCGALPEASTDKPRDCYF